jgi:hypothetical protein
MSRLAPVGTKVRSPTLTQFFADKAHCWLRRWGMVGVSSAVPARCAYHTGSSNYVQTLLSTLSAP